MEEVREIKQHQHHSRLAIFAIVGFLVVLTLTVLLISKRLQNEQAYLNYSKAMELSVPQSQLNVGGGEQNNETINNNTETTMNTQRRCGDQNTQATCSQLQFCQWKTCSNFSDIGQCVDYGANAILNCSCDRFNYEEKMCTQHGCKSITCYPGTGIISCVPNDDELIRSIISVCSYDERCNLNTTIEKCNNDGTNSCGWFSCYVGSNKCFDKHRPINTLCKDYLSPTPTSIPTPTSTCWGRASSCSSAGCYNGQCKGYVSYKCSNGLIGTFNIKTCTSQTTLNELAQTRCCQ